MSEIHTIERRTFARVAAVMALGLLAAGGPRVAAQAPAKPAAATPAAAAASADGGWPRAYTTPSGAALVVYQPQIASWTDQKHVVAVRGGVLHAEGRREAGARHRQGGSGHERRARRAAGQLLGVPDHRIELPDAAAGSGPRRWSRN